MREEQSRRALAVLREFLTTPLDTALDRHRESDPGQAALALFHSVTAGVPAYRAFLRDQGVEVSTEKEQAIAASILAQLRRLNSEFANYVPAEYQLPRVTLAPAGDPQHFPVGVKHRYTRKPVDQP